MITEFSSGYNIVEVDIIQHGDSRAVLPADLYEHLHSTYSADIPLIVKLKDIYLTAFPELSVPAETLVLPDDLDAGGKLGRNESMLVVKGERAKTVFQNYVF